MIFRPSRTRRGDDRSLRLRTLIFLAGGALCIAGLVLERALLFNLAIAILAIGLILGLAGRRRSTADNGSMDDESEQEDG